MPRDETLDLVRSRVKSLLLNTPSYHALEPARQRQLAHDMVKVARYVVDADGETAGLPMTAQVATGLAGPDRAQQTRDVTKEGKIAGDQISGGAARAGSAAFTDTIRRVNFPGFVAGLVDGVFNAIVSSSIKQMEAYGELVANIAKSADEYMRDNITENQARDYLASKYPQHLKVDTASKDGPKLVPRSTTTRRSSSRRTGPAGRGGVAQSLAGAPGLEMPDFMKDLGLAQPVTKLDPKTVEQQLVPAARKRMAMDRQQLLATMVLMGINRLIVTDGKIAASCLFQLDTTEAVYNDTTAASDFDEKVEQTDRSWRYWFLPTQNKKTTSNFTVSTTNNSMSESDIKLHAELTGNVDINFRSETFPLEKVADLIQIKEIEEKAPQAAATPTVAPRQPINLPPPPALPALPGAPGAAPAPAPGGGGV